MLIIALAAACIVAVALQDIIPGKWWYHSGTYALVIVALCVLMLWRLQKSRSRDAFRSLVVISAAGTLLTLVGLAAGLLGPDTQTYTGAPGATLPISEPAGTLRFPVFSDPKDRSQSIQFTAANGGSVAIPQTRRRYAGAYVMWSDPSAVALVSAEDAAGRRLTVTQPTNASFLSPVLLFSQTAKIGGRTLPVDSFSLPAVQRIVKAVLFPATTLSKIQNRAVSEPALLVAVEDARGKLLPGAIRLLPSGQRVRVGGVIVDAVIADYPRVTIAAAPQLLILFLGMAAFLGGLIWYGLVRSSSRSRS